MPVLAFAAAAALLSPDEEFLLAAAAFDPSRAEGEGGEAFVSFSGGVGEVFFSWILSDLVADCFEEDGNLSDKFEIVSKILAVAEKKE